MKDWGSGQEDSVFIGFILDLDGTVYLSDQLISGADRVIRLIKESGRTVLTAIDSPVQSGIILAGIYAKIKEESVS